MVLDRFVAEDLPLQFRQEIGYGADLRPQRWGQVGRRGSAWYRRSGRDLVSAGPAFRPQPIGDREGEGFVHGCRSHRGARQAPDPQQHLAEIFDPLAAGFTASQVVARPLEVLAVEPVVEHRAGRDTGAAVALKT